MDVIQTGKMRLMRTVLILSVLLLTGCASTQYIQREGSFWGNGYYDKKIQEGVYKVGYTGNAYTLGDAADDLTLLRAADVALQNGYSYFVIIDRAKRTNVNSSYSPLMPYSYKGNTYFTGGYSTTTYAPDIEMTIRCSAKKPLDTREMIYDAKEIKTNLGDKYIKKKDETKPVVASIDKKTPAKSELATASPSVTSSPNSESGGISSEDKAVAENAFDAALGHS